MSGGTRRPAEALAFVDSGRGERPSAMAELPNTAGVRVDHGAPSVYRGCSNGTRPGFRDVWPTFAGATDGQESRRWQRSSTRMKGNGDTLPLGTIQDPGRPLHVGYETRGL